jgi:hypothetical protein
MLDRAVLAGRIERLKDDDQRVLLAGPKNILHLGEFGNVLEQSSLGRRFVLKSRGERRIVVGQIDLFSWRNKERFVIQAMRLRHGAVLRSYFVFFAGSTALCRNSPRIFVRIS